MLCEINPQDREILEKFTMYLEQKGYSNHTIKNYELTIVRFLSAIKKGIDEITENDLNKFFEILKDSGCTHSTVYSYLSVLKSFFDFIKNPLKEKVILPKIEKKLPVFLTKEEVFQLFDSITNERDLCIIRLLYASGLRVSEIVKLDRNDIEGTRVLVRSGKGKKDRVAYIDQVTSELISAYLRKRKDNIPALFVNNREERISQRSIQTMVKKYAKRAGIKKNVTPHTLRHTFATHLLQEGADIVTIQTLLGHTNLSTTQIYTHVTDKHTREMYEKAHPLSIHMLTDKTFAA